MSIVTKNSLESYMPNDEEVLSHLSRTEFNYSVYTDWLKDSLVKRCIFWTLYNDLLKKNELSVLDVGGGITPYSSLLRKNCRNYEICDILSHDMHLEPLVSDYLFKNDWYDLSPKQVDVVIANDLFPNADQRLDIFLDKYLPFCKELRISVTYYNSDRFYIVQRLNAEEKLVYRPYNGEICRSILSKYKDRINGFNQKDFDAIFTKQGKDSLFPNNRHVAVFNFIGDSN